MHAGLAHGKPAPAMPAEHEGFPAAMALALTFCQTFFPAFYPPPGCAFFVYHINALLLLTKR
jgi:hypothetical protein